VEGARGGGGANGWVIIGLPSFSVQYFFYYQRQPPQRSIISTVPLRPKQIRKDSSPASTKSDDGITQRSPFSARVLTYLEAGGEFNSCGRGRVST